MARPAINEARSRLHLELPERVRNRLEEIRVLSEADSLTEVVRRALAVYDVLLVAVRDRKEKVVLRSEDGKERELVIP